MLADRSTNQPFRHGCADGVREPGLRACNRAATLLRNQRAGVAATHGSRHETARARLIRDVLSPIRPLREGIRARRWVTVRVAAVGGAVVTPGHRSACVNAWTESLPSFKFVYRQTHKAREALDDAFSPAVPDSEAVLFELAVTKAWLRQLIVALVLIGRGCNYPRPARGVAVTR
jgi:hypothetical protein